MFTLCFIIVIYIQSKPNSNVTQTKRIISTYLHVQLSIVLENTYVKCFVFKQGIITVLSGLVTLYGRSWCTLILSLMIVSGAQCQPFNVGVGAHICMKRIRTSTNVTKIYLQKE